MYRSRIFAAVGLVAVLAAAVLWMLQRENPGSTGQDQPKMEATLQPPPVVTTDHSVAGGSSISKDLGMLPVQTRHPNQVLPAGATKLKPTIVAVGLERVHLTLDSSGNVGFAERVHAIRAIRGKLTGNEMDAFSNYLRTPTRGSGSSDGERWLRNEMLDALVQQADLSPSLTGLLVAVYQDTSQDPVMRDYAIQHMAPIYGQVSPDDQKSLGKALWQATGETGSSIAGTALLALLTIAETSPTVDQSGLADTAFKLATDSSSTELDRITAVQVCGRLGVQQALPVIEQLAQQSPSMPLRIAASAALGDYAMMENSPGSANASKLLANLAQSSDPRQTVAAEAALRRIARAKSSLARGTGP